MPEVVLKTILFSLYDVQVKNFSISPAPRSVHLVNGYTELP